MATPTTTTKTNPARERLKINLIGIGIAVAVMWVIEIFDALIMNQSMNGLGIHPREAGGLWGIALAPLLHGDFAHLTSNTMPFAILGFFTLLRGFNTFMFVTLFTTVVGGLCVWLIGESLSSHIGASGLIFGYFGFLVAIGVLERSLKAIGVAIMVGLLYGGIIFGIMPGQPGVSWEGHLFGFLAGIAAAFLVNKKRLERQPAKA